MVQIRKVLSMSLVRNRKVEGEEGAFQYQSVSAPEKSLEAHLIGELEGLYKQLKILLEKNFLLHCLLHFFFYY